MLQKREDGVYYVVDDLAEYPGGHDTMIAFIAEMVYWRWYGD